MAATKVTTPAEQPISVKDALLDCSICLQLFHEPMRIPLCNHSFCRHCFAASCKAKLRPSCPACRGPVTGARPNERIQEILDLFLAANPGFKYSREDIEGFEKEYEAASFGPGDFTLQEVQDELEQAEGYVFAKQEAFRNTLEEVEEVRKDLDQAYELACAAHSYWVNRIQSDRQGGLQIAAMNRCADAEQTQTEALLKFMTTSEKARRHNETLLRALDALNKVRRQHGIMVAHLRDERYQQFLARTRQHNRSGRDYGSPRRSPVAQRIAGAARRSAARATSNG